MILDMSIKGFYLFHYFPWICFHQLQWLSRTFLETLDFQGVLSNLWKL